MDKPGSKLKVALLLNQKMYSRTFAGDAVSRMNEFTEIVNCADLPETVDESYIIENIRDAQVAVTCWGTPKLTKKIFEAAPDLKVIAHAAGSPRGIVNQEDWPADVRMFTAAPIIATDVAETALWAMIDLLKYMTEFNNGMKNGDWFRNLLDLKDGTRRLNYRLTVGVVSASMVGRKMIDFLKPFGVKILLYDPYVTESDSHIMGVKKCSLDELISSSDVVTIHAPSLPATQGLISRHLIQSLKNDAVFINTSRGPVVDEEALIKELKTGRIRAYLDVFDTEPLPLKSELYTLPNVRLSPHMAGGHTINGGYERGDYVVEQLTKYHTQGSLLNEVLRDRLNIIA